MIDLGNQANRDYLLDEKAQIFQFLKREKVEKLFDSNPVSNHYSKFLFSFINARIFLEMI